MTTELITRLPWDVGRVLQTGDLHLDPRVYADQVPVLQWILGEVHRRRVDLVILCGDLFGHARPHLSSPGERLQLLRWVQQLRDVGAYVLIVRGNHDEPDDWRWVQVLDGVRYYDRPQTLILGADDPLAVHVLPYPDRSWLAAYEPSRDDVDDREGEALRTILLGFQSAAADCNRRLLTAHAATRGAKVSTGQPLIGTEAELRVPWLLESGAQLCMLNHIHLPQSVSDGQVAIDHVGSPWPTDYGETEAKRVLLVEWQDGTPCLLSLPTPCVMRWTADLHWAPDSRSWELVYQAPIEANDMLRLKLRLHYPHGAEIDVAAARAVFPGARAYRIERCPVREREERAPEVVRATTMRDRFVAFEEAENREAQPRALDLLDELLEEVRL